MEFLVGARQKVMISLFIVFRFYTALLLGGLAEGRRPCFAEAATRRHGWGGCIYKSIHFFEFYKSLVLSGL